MGTVTAALGVLLIVYPLIAAAITSVVIGSVLLLVGVVEIVLALNSHTAGRTLMRLLLGIVYIAAGFLLLAFPLLGVAVLTVVLGVMLLFQAAMAIALAFHIRPAPAWGWFLFDGAITLILAVLILYGWPASALWAIGTLVGAAILVRGITRIALSLTLRRVAKKVIQFPDRRVA
jgi:uncharacterized membrane protein HdeD (DUF308 family)